MEQEDELEGQGVQIPEDQPPPPVDEGSDEAVGGGAPDPEIDAPDAEAAENGDPDGTDTSGEGPQDAPSEEEFFPDCGCGLDTVCLTEMADSGQMYEQEVTDDAGDEVSVTDGSASPEEGSAAPEEGSETQVLPESQSMPVPETPAGQDMDPLGPENEDVEADEDEADTTCFVATAAFRDHAHPDVAFLRQFRNRVLRESPFGRAFISLYWRVGPVLARPVRQSDSLAGASRVVIRGVVRMIRAFWRG